MKYILIILSALYLTGCMTPEKATAYLKDKGQLAEVCADEYPVRDSIVVKDSFTFDTVYVGSDPVFDTVTQVFNDTVTRVITKTLPAKVITKTQVQVKEVYRENTARVAALQGEIQALKTDLSEQTDKTTEAQGEAGKWRKKAKTRWWWIVALIAFAFRRQIVGLVTKNSLNMFKTILPFSALFLTGCGRHRDGTSVWAEGLWALPAILSIASLLFFLVAWRASRSGSSKQIPGRGTVYSDKNVRIWNVWAFWFGVALAIVDIAVIIAVNGEKG